MTVVRPKVFNETLPDGAFVRHDAEGRCVFKFALEYRFNGLLWASEIWAYSLEDAETRVQAMRSTLDLCGQVFCEVQA